MENKYLELNNFDQLERLGAGQFGEVYKIREKATGNIYAAKISKEPLSGESISKMRDLLREVNIMYKLIHPTIERFIGFSACNFLKEPKPIIVTEYLPNGSLNDLIKLERQSRAGDYWNETRKLITIYGIASAMDFLHSNKIIHRDLKPDNILMDEHLIPKIADFGLSKIQHSKESMTMQSSANIKGTPIYIAPEIWENLEYTPACDVYSFGMIVYEIITNDEPYPSCANMFSLLSMVKNGERPIFRSPPPDAYKDLIELCWDNNPLNRPTFEEILLELRENTDFITESIDENDYYDFIDYIDQCQSSFDPSKKMIQIDQFINRETKTFSKISIKGNSNLKASKNFFERIRKGSQKMKMEYPQEDFQKLDEECQSIVIEAETNIDTQSFLGKCLIEGINNFPQNTAIGIKYLKNSISNGSINALVYYSKILIKGDVVPKDLEKAKKYLKKHLKDNNADIFLLYGIIKKKTNDFPGASKYFVKASKEGNAEAMYQYGKMLLKGIGVTKNEKEAQKYFEMSRKNGFLKSDKYLPRQESPINLSSSRHKSLSVRALQIQKRNVIPGNDFKRKSFKERKLMLSSSQVNLTKKDEESTEKESKNSVDDKIANFDKQKTASDIPYRDSNLPIYKQDKCDTGKIQNVSKSTNIPLSLSDQLMLRWKEMSEKKKKDELESKDKGELERKKKEELERKEKEELERKKREELERKKKEELERKEKEELERKKREELEREKREELERKMREELERKMREELERKKKEELERKEKEELERKKREELEREKREELERKEKEELERKKREELEREKREELERKKRDEQLKIEQEKRELQMKLEFEEKMRKLKEQQDKLLDEQKKAIELQTKALEEQKKAAEEKNRALLAQNKAIEEQRKAEELRKKDAVVIQKNDIEMGANVWAGMIASLSNMLSNATVTIYNHQVNSSAPPSSPIETIERNVAYFNGIEVSQQIQVFLTQGNKQSVEIKAERNCLPIIDTIVQGQILYISLKGSCNVTPCIYITMNELNKINIYHSSTVNGQNHFNVNDIMIDLSGATKLNLDLDSANIILCISGSSEIKLNGITRALNASISGCSRLNAEKLVSTSSYFNVSGCSFAQAIVKSELSYSVSGYSKFIYTSNPAITSSYCESSSTVIHY